MAYLARKDKAFEDSGAHPWLIPRRSEGRIKIYRSSHDVRAWSHVKEDRRQYILELILADLAKCAGRFIPIESLLKALQACSSGAAEADTKGGTKIKKEEDVGAKSGEKVDEVKSNVSDKDDRGKLEEVNVESKKDKSNETDECSPCQKCNKCSKEEALSRTVGIQCKDRVRFSKSQRCAAKRFSSCGAISTVREDGDNISKQRQIAKEQGLVAYIRSVVLCSDPSHLENKKIALAVIEENLAGMSSKEVSPSDSNDIRKQEVCLLRKLVDEYRIEADELKEHATNSYVNEQRYKKMITQQSERIKQLELWSKADRTETDRLVKQLTVRCNEVSQCHEMVKCMKEELDALRLQTYRHLNDQQDKEFQRFRSEQKLKDSKIRDLECKVKDLEKCEQELCKLKSDKEKVNKKQKKKTTNVCQGTQSTDKGECKKLMGQIKESKNCLTRKNEEISSLQREVEFLKCESQKQRKKMEETLGKMKCELDKKESIVKQFGSQLIQLQNQLRERECRLQEAERNLKEMREQMYDLKVKFDANRDEIDRLYEQLCEKHRSLRSLQEDNSSCA